MLRYYGPDFCLATKTLDNLVPIKCQLSTWSLVMFLYSDISNFTFWNVNILKLISFLNELGNFKQKNFYTLKWKFFLHFTTTDPYTMFGNYFSFFVFFRFCVILDKCQDDGQLKTILLLALIDDPTSKTIGQ